MMTAPKPRIPRGYRGRQDYSFDVWAEVRPALNATINAWVLEHAARLEAAPAIDEERAALLRARLETRVSGRRKPSNTFETAREYKAFGVRVSPETWAALERKRFVSHKGRRRSLLAAGRRRLAAMGEPS